MITIVARLTMQEGKEEAAIEQARSMVKSVEAEEPGALAYACHRSQENPSEIVFYEVYADEEAAAAHRKTPHMARMNKVFRDLFTPPVRIEKIDRIEGFFR